MFLLFEIFSKQDLSLVHCHHTGIPKLVILNGLCLGCEEGIAGDRLNDNGNCRLLA
jgi:hypothetical protein